MKQIILIGVLTGLLSATIPLRAQIAGRDLDGRKGSRLELGRTSTEHKTTTPVLPSRRALPVPNPALAASDRPITIYKNAPINEHYRGLLMSRSVTKPAARTGAADNAPVASVETHPVPGQEIKAENRMYANDRLWVSNAYPNPADDAAELDYQFSGSPVNGAKLVVLNVLGTPVAEYELDRNDRKLRIITRDLSTGYYLYQLSVEGRKVATKRLLVRHQ